MSAAADIDGKIADNRRWVLEKLKRNGDVPCGSCKACCFNKAVFLYVEAGDKPELFDTEMSFNQYWGGWQPRLKHKEDGACVYLTERGCGVWARRPMACRAYSCIDQFEMLSRAERKRLKREGQWTKTHEAGERQWLIRNGKRTG